MPDLTPKTPELLQAQIATFASERLVSRQDKVHLFDNLSNLALASVEDVTRTTNSREYHKDESGNLVSVPEGSSRLITTGEEYNKFLRSVGGSNYESIQGRADMLTAYSQFAPSINKLREDLAILPTRKEHQTYLGSGSNSTVFAIENDGKDFAVRIPRGQATNPTLIDRHLAGAVLGKGVPGLEQIVAASYEDGVTVAEKMPGKEVGDLGLDDIDHITDGQLGNLVDTLVEVQKRGIEIDPKPSNIFYDPNAGFGIVDYHSSREAGKTSSDQDLGTVVGWMATGINNAGFFGKPYKDERSSEDYARDLEFQKANLGVLKRYRNVVDQKLTNEDREKALQEIDSKVESLQESVENHSNPEWVSQRLLVDKEYQEQRAKRLSKQASITAVNSGVTTFPLDTV